MQKNVKTMWFYVIIIVFVATMLILVSSVSDVNNNFVSEENETMGKIDKSLTMLTSQNEELNKKLKETENELNEIKSNSEKTIESQKNLILSMKNYFSEDYEDSCMYLQQVVIDVLDEECNIIYKNIKDKLKVKGYTFE